MASVIVALDWVLNIAKVVFGLGFVIFIHELGHFLAAKWNGVKVEKFFLGFDFFGMRIWSFRHGETEYGIGGIPLGGYVKMLGEDSGEGGEKSTDPRAYSNKSVGARIVILSAGVAMNILLGLILFTTTHMLGVFETPARLGYVQAGSPAYEAGLREGDEIVSINGKGDVHFQRLLLNVSLSVANRKLVFGVKRPGVSDVLTIPVEPQRNAKAGMPRIGIGQSRSLTYGGWEDLTGSEGPALSKEALPPGSKILKAGAKGGPLVDVEDYFALERVLVDNRDHAVDILVETKAEKDKPVATIIATLPINHMLTFGLRLTPGIITSIQAGSIAEKAGFRIGDRLVKVNGRDDFDPMRLPDDLYARAGAPTAFAVERAVDGKPQTVEISATPDNSTPVYVSVAEKQPFKIPGLGFAMTIETKIAAVDANSPAAKAGIKPGAIIKEMVVRPLVEKAKKEEPTRWSFGDSSKPEEGVIETTWPLALLALQERPKSVVQLTFDDSKVVLLNPEPDPTWTNPERGLGMMSAFREIPPQPFGVALKRGTDDTYDNITTIYATLRSLFSGRVSPKNLMGLPRISSTAFQAASAGIVSLLTFLGVISINLAVLNFLPIPPLDGGQIAFVVAEKIRGKPLGDSTLNILLIGGIVLVIGLMLFTIIQDVVLLIIGRG